MTETPDEERKGFIARQLQQSRQRLDQYGLLGSYVASNVLSDLKSIFIGVVVTISVVHGCTMEERFERLETAVTEREGRILQNVRDLQEDMRARAMATDYNMGEFKGKLEVLQRSIQ